MKREQLYYYDETFTGDVNRRYLRVYLRDFHRDIHIYVFVFSSGIILVPSPYFRYKKTKLRSSGIQETIHSTLFRTRKTIFEIR